MLAVVALAGPVAFAAMIGLMHLANMDTAKRRAIQVSIHKPHVR